MRQWIRYRSSTTLGALLGAVLGAVDLLTAQTREQPHRSSAIELAVETSRSQLVAGAGLGIVAMVTNVSDSTVFLRERDFTLTLPVELEGGREVYGWAAFFPTERHQTGAPYDQFYSAVIALKPGDSYNTFWTSGPQSSKADTSSPGILDQIQSQLRFVFFAPGDYKITVVAKYWSIATLPEGQYRTVTQSVTTPVAAPQFVILFGAALGGLIAYSIFSRARRRKAWQATLSGWQGFAQRTFKEATGVLAAVLLSTIVTILLSRIAETQFIVRVTVNDFWGAITVGFVANYAGSRVLDRLIPAVDDKTGASSKTAPAGSN